MEFAINGIVWTVFCLPPYSMEFWTGDGFTIGMTDLDKREVYLSDELHGDMLHRVWIHELCHCFAYSYGLLVKPNDEECMCQIMEQFSIETSDLGNVF